MKENLNLDSEKDAIAFLFSYYADDKPSIEIANITHISHENRKVGVNFLYGYKSVHEWVDFDDIVAIMPAGNDFDYKDVTAFKIRGWKGYYKKILKPDIWNQFIV